MKPQTNLKLPQFYEEFKSNILSSSFQISTIHNEIPESPEDAGFELDVLVLESYESSKNTRCTDYYMKVCARYHVRHDYPSCSHIIVHVKVMIGKK